MKATYRCWAEIDRNALRHNAKVVRDRVGSAQILAVVKANAYGHGLTGTAQTLSNDVQLFGVANLEEALVLRESLSHPIVILGPAALEERSVIAERRFIPTISDFEEAQAFSRLAGGSQPRPIGAKADATVPAPGQRLAINFKIDTGMGRM